MDALLCRYLKSKSLQDCGRPGLTPRFGVGFCGGLWKDQSYAGLSFDLSAVCGKKRVLGVDIFVGLQKKRCDAQVRGGFASKIGKCSWFYVSTLNSDTCSDIWDMTLKDFLLKILPHRDSVIRITPHRNCPTIFALFTEFREVLRGLLRRIPWRKRKGTCFASASSLCNIFQVFSVYFVETWPHFLS